MPARAPAHATAARTVAPEIVAPPPLDPAELQRTEPRKPLSDLALALPPKPVPPDKWKGTLLFRPVAVAAARFEAMGRTVALAGVDGVDAGRDLRARGRAPVALRRARPHRLPRLAARALASCAIPPESDRQLVVATCRLGKQDVGHLAGRQWLGGRSQAGPTRPAPAAREKQAWHLWRAPPGVVRAVPAAAEFLARSPNFPPSTGSRSRARRGALRRAPRASRRPDQPASSPASALPMSARVSAMP